MWSERWQGIIRRRASASKTTGMSVELRENTTPTVSCDDGAGADSGAADSGAADSGDADSGGGGVPRAASPPTHAVAMASATHQARETSCA